METETVWTTVLSFDDNQIATCFFRNTEDLRSQNNFY